MRCQRYDQVNNSKSMMPFWLAYLLPLAGVEKGQIVCGNGGGDVVEEVGVSRREMVTHYRLCFSHLSDLL